MNSKVFKVSIVLAWVILISCFILTALGLECFAFEDGISPLDGNIPFIIALSSISSFLCFSIYYLAICERWHFNVWTHLGLFFYFCGISVLKILVIPNRFWILLDLVSNFVIPVILVRVSLGKFLKCHLKSYFKILIAFALNCGFQSIAVMVRSIAIDVTVANILSEALITFDVFVMLVLYWLYTMKQKEEVKKMGRLFTFLLGKNKEELEAVLKDIEKKLVKTPEDAMLLEEKAEVERLLAEV